MSLARRVGVGALVLVVAVLVGGCGEDDAGGDDRLAGVRPIRYGDESSQIGELTLPNELGPHPVVVLIHGGWWRADDFDRRHMRDLADDLADHGYATWNLEYRLVGEEGGGWPGTFADVATGIDHLAELAPENELDLDRVTVVGHSAGGQLALWASERGDLPPGTPGAEPVVEVAAVVALAPVTDLVGAAQQNMGNGAVPALLGGQPADVADVYDVASPRSRLPYDAPVLLVHGTADEKVPVEQTLSFASAAEEAGDAFEVMILDGVGHFAAIDTDREVWPDVRGRIGELLDLAAEQRDGG